MNSHYYYILVEPEKKKKKNSFVVDKWGMFFFLIVKKKRKIKIFIQISNFFVLKFLKKSNLKFLFLLELNLKFIESYYNKFSKMNKT